MNINERLTTLEKSFLELQKNLVPIIAKADKTTIHDTEIDALRQTSSDVDETLQYMLLVDLDEED